MTPPPSPDLRAALHLAGRRYTRQRERIFAHLRAVSCHPTAEQVFAAVRREIPNLGLATVYEALEALVAAGLAARLADHAGGPVRYDGRPEPHYHLRCEVTGEVSDLDVPFEPDLPARLGPDVVAELRRRGFAASSHRLEIVGRFVGSAELPEGAAEVVDQVRRDQ